MMGQTLVPQADILKRAGCDMSQLNKFLRSDLGRCAKVGTKVNTDHPGVKFWLGRRLAGTRGKISDKERSETLLAIENYVSGLRSDDMVAQDEETDAVFDFVKQAHEDAVNLSLREFSDYLEMPLGTVIKKHGTDRMFKEYLQSVKSIEDITEKRLKNRIRSGELVEREFVESMLFSLIDTSYARLLNDSPRTIAGRVVDASKSGETMEDMEDMVKSLISDQIVTVKMKMTRILKKAARGARYANDE